MQLTVVVVVLGKEKKTKFKKRDGKLVLERICALFVGCGRVNPSRLGKFEAECDKAAMR